MKFFSYCFPIAFLYNTNESGFDGWHLVHDDFSKKVGNFYQKKQKLTNLCLSYLLKTSQSLSKIKY